MLVIWSSSGAGSSRFEVGIWTNNGSFSRGFIRAFVLAGAEYPDVDTSPVLGGMPEASVDALEDSTAAKVLCFNAGASGVASAEPRMRCGTEAVERNGLEKFGGGLPELAGGLCGFTNAQPWEASHRCGGSGSIGPEATDNIDPRGGLAGAIAVRAAVLAGDVEATLARIGRASAARGARTLKGRDL